MAKIPILPGGGVPVLDLPGLRALGNVGESFNRGRLTAERLQDIAEARADREDQRSLDVAQTAILQDPRNEFGTAAGIRDVGGRFLEAGLADPGMTFLDRATGMEDAALNRRLTQARLGEVGAARRSRETAAKTAQDQLAAQNAALVSFAEANGIDPALVGTGLVKSAAEKSIVPQPGMSPFQEETLRLKQEEATSKAATRAAKTAEKKEIAKRSATRAISSANIAVRAIDQALDLIKNNTFGVTGITGAFNAMPGSDRRAFESALGTIKGNVAIDELIKLKQAGGTFGALNESELELLKGAQGALDPNLGEDVLIKTLNNLKAGFSELLPSGQAAQGGVGTLQRGETVTIGNSTIERID